MKLLSSWSYGNVAPLNGLKSTIDSLLQDLQSVLSSFKQELPWQKEVAIALIYEISPTEKSIAKAQLEKDDLNQQICKS